MARASGLEQGSLPVLLNCHSHFSFGAGVSSPRTLVAASARAGFSGLALTDLSGVYGAVELHQSAREHGVAPSVGATVPLSWNGESYSLVLLCATRTGYANLNELLSHLHQESLTLTPNALEPHAMDLFCLSGPRAGFLNTLLGKREIQSARDLTTKLKDIFGERLLVQLFHDSAPRDAQRGRMLRRFAGECGLKIVAAPEIRYARPDLFPLFDALVCARLGLTVEDDHPARGLSDAQHPHDPHYWARRFPYPEALGNAANLLEECRWELLPETLVPALAKVPAGMSAQQHLEARANGAAEATYRNGDTDQNVDQNLSQTIGQNIGDSTRWNWSQLQARLSGELKVIHSFELADFFLVAAEVTDYCRSRGILASGRGSAAGSLVCYLLGITNVDPLEHNLLFERFLYAGKKSMPDVDIDLSSRRRREVISWVEQRFGHSKEAMAANKITYRLPSAVKDLGRALGLPSALVDTLTKTLGRDFRHLRPHRAREAQLVFDLVLKDAPVKETLLGLLENIERGQVRHLAPHSGGVVLSHDPLHWYSPLMRSSGGIQLLQFDKDDIEALGLIKLDLLGLRMLSALEEARNFIVEDGRWLDLYSLPDSEQVWDKIGQGDTMGLFQIESPAQTATAVKLKPSNLRMLGHQIALIRPGPIQSGTVHPFIRRARGKERICYPHPKLEAILKPTLGVILYQEQQLRVAHCFAGYSWPRADRLRKRVSSQEEDTDLEDERLEFLYGALKHSGATLEQAEEVWSLVCAFSGFGFAQSHAVAFSHHTYASAYLREHHPAAYLAGLLEADPGMWSRATLTQDAQRWGVRLLPLEINRSGVRFRPEWAGGKVGVRLPFHTLGGLSQEAGAEVVLERLRGGPFLSLTDLYGRVKLDFEQFEALIRGGSLEQFGTRREGLYTLETLRHTFPAGSRAMLGPEETPPTLAKLETLQSVLWDRELKGMSETGLHPLDLLGGELAALGCTPLEQALRNGGRTRTAGLVIARQKPPTAAGFAFWTLEHGPNRVQAILSPTLWAAHTATLRDARALIVEGTIKGEGRAWTLKVETLSTLPLG